MNLYELPENVSSKILPITEAQVLSQNGEIIAKLDLIIQLLQPKPRKSRAARKQEADTEWLERLSKEKTYAGIQVMHEYGKAYQWCLAQKPVRKCSRQFFINWLNRIERNMTAKAPIQAPPAYFKTYESLPPGEDMPDELKEKFRRW